MKCVHTTPRTCLSLTGRNAPTRDAYLSCLAVYFIDADRNITPISDWRPKVNRTTKRLSCDPGSDATHSIVSDLSRLQEYPPSRATHYYSPTIHHAQS